jgi:hypothetical protein
MPIIFTEGLEPVYFPGSFDSELQHVKLLYSELLGSTAYVNKLQIPVTNLVTKIDSRTVELNSLIATITADIATLVEYTVVPIDENTGLPAVDENGDPLDNLPAGWKAAGQDVAGIQSIISALSSLNASIPPTISPTLSELKTEINTVDIDNFKLHMDLWSGVREIPPAGIVKPSFIPIMGLVRGLTDIEHRFGITFTNYLELVFETLFIADLTISNAQTHLDSDPFDGVTYSSLNVVGRVGADPFTETPSAIVSDITPLTSSHNSWNTTAATYKPIFEQHVLDDMAEYDSMNAKIAGYLVAYNVSGHIQEPYYRFMYTDVVGTQEVIDIINRYANGEIT